MRSAMSMNLMLQRQEVLQAIHVDGVLVDYPIAARAQHDAGGQRQSSLTPIVFRSQSHLGSSA